MKNLICKLFGHFIDENCMIQNNVQYCLRCSDQRAFYYDGTNYWTDLEYYGLIGYPLWRLKTYILSKYIWFKLKTGKLRVTKQDENDSVPF